MKKRVFINLLKLGLIPNCDMTDSMRNGLLAAIDEHLEKPTSPPLPVMQIEDAWPKLNSLDSYCIRLRSGFP